MVRDFKGLGAPRHVERIVKPHKDYTVRMPIMVCDAFGDSWFERKKHKWGLIELVEYLRKNWPKDKHSSNRTQPIMLVCEFPERVLAVLHAHYKNDPEWNHNLKEKQHDQFLHVSTGSVKEPKIKQLNNTVKFFGFRDAHRKTKYFYPVCPHDFLDFREYEPDLPDRVRLYKFGGETRRFMQRNKLRFSSTRAGLASQFLRDKRFYPNSRRKVPKATNEKARLALPGNFYQSLRKPSTTIKVYVIDQENAHHYAAETVSLPNANQLFGRGRFGTSNDGRYARYGSELFGRLLSEYGLFRVRATVPRYLRGYLPPWCEVKPGVQSFYLFSNEFEFARELGVEIRAISHAWTSPYAENGLRKYAQFAQSYVRENPEHKKWAKPLFLSAYGLLGARPRKISNGYYRSLTGEKKTYFLGGIPIQMKHIESKREIQTPTANVIHRGMIEAETRKLSIQLARQMTDEGHNVVAIHADAVIVRDEGQNLPILPAPWRVKEILYQFEMVDKVSFVSEQRAVLPGRKRET